MAGGIVRLRQLALIPDVHPRRLGAGLIADLGGAPVGPVSAHAVVYLAVVGVADVITLGVMLMDLQLNAGVGPGAGGLGLQGLQGPGPAHLVGGHAPRVVVQRNHVDDRHVTAAHPPVLKAALVLIPGEPGSGGGRSGHVGHHAEMLPGPAVELEQNTVCAGSHYGNAVRAGAYHGAVEAHTRQGALGALGGGVGAYPDLIGTVDPGHEAVENFRVVPGVGVVVVHAGYLDVIAPHQWAAVAGGLVAGAAEPEVLAFQHRNPGLGGVGPGQLHKAQAAVKVAEPVACTVPGVVLQIGRGECAGGVGQAYPEHI